MSAEGWTPERGAKLKTLWLQGLSASAIARQLGGTTRCAVIAKVHRLGLPGRVSHHNAPKPMPKRKPPAATIARQDGPQSAGKGAPMRFAQAAGARLAPPTQPAPVKLRAPPAKGENSVRFIDRKARQCAMFCDGESGPDGFVCGRPAQGSWCKNCEPLVFAPVKQGKAA